jgi:predicted small lipoprotein YifL
MNQVMKQTKDRMIRVLMLSLLAAGFLFVMTACGSPAAQPAAESAAPAQEQTVPKQPKQPKRQLRHILRSETVKRSRKRSSRLPWKATALLELWQTMT